MDWINAALNEKSGSALHPHLNMSSKGGDDLTPPRFDQFLSSSDQRTDESRQGQRPQEPQGQRRPSPGGNKQGVHFESQSRSASQQRRLSDGRAPFDLSPSVRYNTAFLSGLMQSQGNQPNAAGLHGNMMPQDKSMGEMINPMAMSMKGGGNTGFSPHEQEMALAKAAFNKGNASGSSGSNNNVGGPSSGGSQQQQGTMGGMQQNTSFSRPVSQGSGNSCTSTPAGSGSGSGSHPVTSSGGGGGASRQKNDKAVEVHHDHKIIARFRTQTECARYLRATPEAVSYHCSKGGGICNGLVIRPLQGVSIPTNDTESFFGLFEGATEHRPSQRPQLKPETVAILKEWLLSPEHMDNPYPNQKESEMLMQRTGLDKTQLKHWFNNARKRILKPLLKSGGRGRLALLNKKTSPSRSKREADRSPSPGPSARKASKKTSSRARGQSPSASSGHDQFSSISASSSQVTHKMSDNLSSNQRGGQFDDRFQGHDFQRGGSNQGQDFHRGGSNQGQDFRHASSASTQASQMPGQFDMYNRGMGMSGGINGMGMMQGPHQGGMGMGFGDQMGMGGMNPMMMNRDMMGQMNSRDMMNPNVNMGMNSRDMMGMGMNSQGMNPMEMMNRMDRMDRSANEMMYGRGGGGSRGGSSGMGGGGMDDKTPMTPYSRGGSYDSYPAGNSPTAGRGGQGFGGPGDGPGGFNDPMFNMNQGGRGGGDGSQDDPTRSNAVFKQQVATMAMNEASSAFKDMEEAFARAKEVLANCRGGGAQHPEDDPRVMEANARAKKCQSVAMFKLKVSQRASEEAAAAYDCYQRMVDGPESGGAGGGGMGMGEGGGGMGMGGGGRGPGMGGNDTF